MALVIQNVAMTSSYVPYERPPQTLTLWSAIPRGLQSFIVANEALDLIAVGDGALLNLQATLPPNFGYVMQDLNLTLAQDSAGTGWTASMSLNLQFFYRAPGILAAVAGNWPQEMISTSQDSSTRQLRVRTPWPSFPIIGAPGTSGVLVNISTFNNAGNAVAAGVINAWISFWQFDLEQIRKYPINSPIPVQAR